MSVVPRGMPLLSRGALIAGSHAWRDGVNRFDQANAQENADKTVSAVLGEIISLMRQSPELKQ